MKELEKLLSKDEFDRFIYNLYSNVNLTRMYENINYIRKHINLPPKSILHTAFSWADTIEGHPYWHRIYTGL
jgi:hypothetical protein